MAVSITLVKQGSCLVPATEADQEKIDLINNGEPVNVKITSKKPRSYKHHCRYWKLLRIALDYWKPTGGLISRDEKLFSVGLVDFVGSIGFDANAVKELLRNYMQHLIAERRKTVITQHRSLDAFHKWVKVEAGYYDSIQTPGGVIKEAKSISFDKMNEHEYKEFYGAAYGVVWNSLLCRKFNSQSELDRIIGNIGSFAMDG